MKNIKFILVGLISAALIFMAGFHFGSLEHKESVSSSLIESTIKESSDLITTKYHYSRVGKFENSIEINGWSVPLTKKNFILQFQGEIQAGVDAKDIQVQIQDNEILVKVPEVKVLNHILEEDSIQVYDEDNNLFNPIHVDDYKTFAVQQKKIALQEAKDNGLMEQAQEQTLKTIQELIESLPQVGSNYTITIQ